MMAKPKDKIVIHYMGARASVDWPKDMSALTALVIMNDAMGDLYRKAIAEEAKKANQMPHSIQHLVDVIRKQRDPESN